MSDERAEGAVQEEVEIGDKEEDSTLTDLFFMRKVESLFVPAETVYALVRNVAKEELVVSDVKDMEKFGVPQAIVVDGEFVGISMKKEKRKVLETWTQWREKRKKVKEGDV